MADALTLDVTYSGAQGRVRPLPWVQAPALFTIVAALYPRPPRARPSLWPTPISHAATTSEGEEYSTVQDSTGLRPLCIF
jgi:hypothetical protein